MDSFSTDLVEGSKKHLVFLTRLHKVGVTLSPVERVSFHRYVDLWLPLVDKFLDKASDSPSASLIPPADIAWLWHCHRLAPSQYEPYVIGRFGCLLEASPSFAVQTDHDSSTDRDDSLTRDVWHEAYPDHPFFHEASLRKDGHELLTSQECRERLGGFDLLAATKSQSGFLWQVSRSQFSDSDFLTQGVQRYKKFLKLASSTSENVVLVPTYQVRDDSYRCMLAWS
jgi:hypothetical protein